MALIFLKIVVRDKLDDLDIFFKEKDKNLLVSVWPAHDAY